jgi:hypothetical protein
MKPKILLENESVILDLDNENEEFLLTSERVRHSKKGWGYNNLTSIQLKEISSISIYYRSYIIFIILALISGIYSLITFFNEGETRFITFSLSFSLLMIIIFFFTRKRIITINASNGKIEYLIKDNDKVGLPEIMDKIELAKFNVEKIK